MAVTVTADIKHMYLLIKNMSSCQYGVYVLDDKGNVTKCYVASEGNDSVTVTLTTPEPLGVFTSLMPQGLLMSEVTGIT